MWIAHSDYALMQSMKILLSIAADRNASFEMTRLDTVLKPSDKALTLSDNELKPLDSVLKLSDSMFKLFDNVLI